MAIAGMRSEKNQHTTTLILSCAAFLGAGIALASLGPNLGWLAERTGTELALLSWIFTCFSAGVVLMQAQLGPLSSRFGLAGVQALGMGLMGVGMLGITVAPNLALLLIASGLSGIGFGGIIGAGNILIARIFQQHSATALNGVNLFFGLGAILGPLIVGQIGARLDRPQAAIWIGGVILIGLAPFIPRVAQHSGAAATQNQRTGPQHAGKAWPVWLLGLVLMIYTGTEVGFSGWVTFYMQKSTGMALSEATLVASAFWLALSGGRLLAAGLGMRLSAHHLLLMALSGLVAGAGLLMLSVGTPAGSFAGALLFGLACGPVFPTTIALINRLSQGNSGLAGMSMGLGNSGGMVLPALIGLLLTSYGPPFMVAAMLTCTLVMLGLGGVVVMRADHARS
ncbi:MFS transporter [Candidatus Oscillochloris fontis]|uniref:MFS transporter n=1 Tax=Candidatus Oscillochloris fontis TaxID=2496868 RepID=UPI0013759B30|nr:MFS transporter [Candidatus Oscillochloris fontis]